MPKIVQIAVTFDVDGGVLIALSDDGEIYQRFYKSNPKWEKIESPIKKKEQRDDN